jgi:hypothetical protein
MQKSFLSYGFFNQVYTVVPGFEGFLLLWDTKSTINPLPPPPSILPLSFKLIKYPMLPLQLF